MYLRKDALSCFPLHLMTELTSFLTHSKCKSSTSAQVLSDPPFLTNRSLTRHEKPFRGSEHLSIMSFVLWQLQVCTEIVFCVVSIYFIHIIISVCHSLSYVYIILSFHAMLFFMITKFELSSIIRSFIFCLLKFVRIGNPGNAGNHVCMLRQPFLNLRVFHESYFLSPLARF